MGGGTSRRLNTHTTGDAMDALSPHGERKWKWSAEIRKSLIKRESGVVQKVPFLGNTGARGPAPEMDTI